ncbi:hypothetical protein CBM2633_P160008 [Cupriavidus taiwanensis]|uniref:Uncharacterized protein n=3 Tax=Cupriavidus TaxID=106589 RepID=A0A375DA15_9BURK|nr:hypothetical protein CBM2588_P180008 [Cupriavidus taiwanensis]SOZ40443.1 hypothetical protein CBM2605_P160007 [Cupriavidus neocaledonicus]SOY74545.1 hypothetical protein CBM2592_P190006 [Cupriavidus taiwanensis]SOY74552.1 hypothetical protein CBM2585_P160008 [Cupriavidus taiwanensis]SOY75442.1 hypothetical protein CBM2589_P160006 [Cupriavidus taiwanensis]
MAGQPLRMPLPETARRSAAVQHLASHGDVEALIRYAETAPGGLVPISVLSPLAATAFVQTTANRGESEARGP